MVCASDEIAAVLATGIADIAITSHLDLPSTMAIRERLADELYKFGLAFSNVTSNGSFGSDWRSYVYGSRTPGATV